MAENEIPALRLFAGAYEDMHMDKKVKIKAPAKKTSGFFDRGQKIVFFVTPAKFKILSTESLGMPHYQLQPCCISVD